jgi:hypothetical protein
MNENLLKFNFEFDSIFNSTNNTLTEPFNYSWYDFTSIGSKKKIINKKVYFIISIILTIWVLYYFTNKKLLAWQSYLAIFITYFICIFSLFLFTIDLAAVFIILIKGFYQCDQRMNGSETRNCEGMIPIPIIVFWYLVYWVLQFVAW